MAELRCTVGYAKQSPQRHHHATQLRGTTPATRIFKAHLSLYSLLDVGVAPRIEGILSLPEGTLPDDCAPRELMPCGADMVRGKGEIESPKPRVEYWMETGRLPLIMLEHSLPPHAIDMPVW